MGTGLRSLAANILVSFVSMLLALAIGIFGIEGAFIFANRAHQDANWEDPDTQFDPELGWVTLPSRKVIHKWGQTSTNSLGFRSDELDPSKELIVLLGDSVTWGNGVSDRRTFSYLLQQRLRDSNYQVVNMAVSGYGIDQHYLYLKRHIEKFKKPNKIFLVICTVNDFVDTGTNTRWGKRKPLFDIRDGELISMHPRIKKYCLRNLLSISFTGRSIEALSGKAAEYLGRFAGDIYLDKEVVQKVIPALIRKISELAGAHGAEFTIVLIPPSHEFSEKSEDWKWFKNLAGQEGYETIDTYEILESRKPDLKKIYKDPWHFSAAGHELLAETLHDFLAPRLKGR